MIPPLVILIGLRAAGKSTVGRRLAALMEREFFELDDATARRAGHASAGDALRTLGQEAFREHEAAALKDLLDRAGVPTVAALGGGTPTAPGATAMLAEAQKDGRAVILYLSVPADRLTARLMTAPGDRPSLTGAEMTAEVHTLYRQRHDLYQSLADHVVLAKHNDPALTAESIRLALVSMDSNPS